MGKSITQGELLAAWSAEAEKLKSSRIDSIPEGFVTRDMLSAELNMRTSDVSEMIRSMLSSGRAESMVFRIVDRIGRARPVKHYRIINEKTLRKVRR